MSRSPHTVALFAFLAALSGCTTKPTEPEVELLPVTINLKGADGGNLKTKPNEKLILEVNGPVRANLEANATGVYTLSAGRTGVPAGKYDVGINHVVNNSASPAAEPTGESIVVAPGKKEFTVTVKK